MLPEKICLKILHQIGNRNEEQEYLNHKKIAKDIFFNIFKNKYLILLRTAILPFALERKEREKRKKESKEPIF